MRNWKIHLLITIMSDRSLNVDVLPITQEQELKVKGQDEDIHVFSIPFSKSGKFIFDVQSQLKNWLPGKGNVHFISMTAFVAFEDVAGRFLIALIAKGASVNDYTEARAWPNRKLFSSNTMNVGKDEEHLFDVPEGYSRLMFPQTGPLPMFDILLYNNTEVAGNVTLFVKLKVSGPRVHRYKCDWTKGSSEQMSGFA